jgi:ABC-type branched-subunit amino acid transport system substrate-binding protein
MRGRLAILALTLVAALTFAGRSMADEGVSRNEILFGQVAALSGPAAALGEGMRLGIGTAFAEANAEGGVHGRRLTLVSRDDGYDPDRSVSETRKAIEDDRVFALIGAVGTPTSVVTAPLAEAAGVPFIAPFTGASLLRRNGLSTVVNFRASYAAEAETWVRYLVDERGIRRIAIFYQDDAFGRDGLAALKAALDARNIDLLAEATFERNTSAVRSGLRTLRRARPEAVVLVGAYKPAAEFIREARRSQFAPLFVSISFVGGEALASELGNDGRGVIVSQVVPLPADRSVKVVADYQRALARFDYSAQPSFVSLEGYLAARMVVQALRRLGPEPTRAALLAELRQIHALQPGDHDASRAAAGEAAPVYLTELGAGGQFRLLRPPLASVPFSDMRGSKP